ncbi:Gfo/Idh/MocA family oxidoreductase (plasmid) [Deinococcus taeanensis]|uniref:Gfo/Idh/MocA family oxidoreductase n=1 Tax=Deinococcus taeanensis TaxID=2737050 RepID=UPI001CDBE0AA|nr:Gfo/Idh/MocA family oxidoreductase [Deinococcus taeanensis]UBV44270.1 Gfo/Idh/MocA family oxidoreductase [Deinococcus taeanensis]
MSLRWGFLGAARLGNALAPAMTAAGQAFWAVAARDPAPASYAAKHGFRRVPASSEDLLLDPDVDAVYNALPSGLHFLRSARALAAGKHVL